MDKHLEIAKVFFKNYGAVFDTGDLELFSRNFTEPFISIRPDGTIQSMPTNESAEAFFGKVLLLWEEEGYKFFAPKDFEVVSIGAKSMLVTLTWELLDERRRLIREWRQSYNLMQGEGAWKVYASTFHTGST